MTNSLLILGFRLTIAVEMGEYVVNDLIRDLKARYAPDGFMGWLHVLMLIDDTILTATSRQRAMEKLHVMTD